MREQVGRPIAGWQSYNSWAYTAECLFDDKLRIQSTKHETDTRVSALEGIRQMRDQLREPQSVVRLIVSSGVGKTRLVQALFDNRIGVQSLNPSRAIYTNMANSPDPQPIGLASHLDDWFHTFCSSASTEDLILMETILAVDAKQPDSLLAAMRAVLGSGSTPLTQKQAA